MLLSNEASFQRDLMTWRWRWNQEHVWVSVWERVHVSVCTSVCADKCISSYARPVCEELMREMCFTVKSPLFSAKWPTPSSCAQQQQYLLSLAHSHMFDIQFARIAKWSVYSKMNGPDDNFCSVANKWYFHQQEVQRLSCLHRDWPHHHIHRHFSLKFSSEGSLKEGSQTLDEALSWPMSTDTERSGGKRESWRYKDAV